MDAAGRLRLSLAMKLTEQEILKLAQASGVRGVATGIKVFQAVERMKEAEKLEDSFYEFCKAAWQWVDPAEFVDNWHLEDICDHMEAVARGHISRLLLNEPPRTATTFIISICFCAWVWAQRQKAPLLGPQVSFFYASYAEK